LPPGHSSRVKEHGAILNADLLAVVFGEGDERLPGLEEARQFSSLCGSSAADKGVYVLRPSFSEARMTF